jgi:hypothetical protein
MVNLSADKMSDKLDNRFDYLSQEIKEVRKDIATGAAAATFEIPLVSALEVFMASKSLKEAASIIIMPI